MYKPFLTVGPVHGLLYSQFD